MSSYQKFFLDVWGGGRETLSVTFCTRQARRSKQQMSLHISAFSISLICQYLLCGCALSKVY